MIDVATLELESLPRAPRRQWPTHSDDRPLCRNVCAHGRTRRTGRASARKLWRARVMTTPRTSSSSARMAGSSELPKSPMCSPPRPTGRSSETMKGNSCPGIVPESDREEAASSAIRLGVASLAVCDAAGRFVGAVPAGALMSILRDEHMEDLHHMAGILGKSEAAKKALTASPHRRALYRLPWLLVGMAGSAVATGMMARFEATLTAHIAVAFFIPAIVYLADAVGTQSEAVAVRGLSLAETGLLSLVAGELGTGILHRRYARRSRLSTRLAGVRKHRARRDGRDFTRRREQHRDDDRLSCCPGHSHVSAMTRRSAPAPLRR